MSITLTGTSSITISRDLDPSSTFYRDRLNHFSRRTVSGNIITYDSGPTLLHGKLVLKLVGHAEAKALQNWINDDIRYCLKPWAISANAWDDLGMGLGIAILICKLDSLTSTEDILKHRGPGSKWDVSLPYVCKIGSNGGLAEL